MDDSHLIVEIDFRYVHDAFMYLFGLGRVQGTNNGTIDFSREGRFSPDEMVFILMMDITAVPASTSAFCVS